MQVFVTGGGRGFIAGHVVRALERAGHSVRREWVDVRDHLELQRAMQDCSGLNLVDVRDVAKGHVLALEHLRSCGR